MECPKYGFAQGARFPECPRCGIVVAKFHRAHADPSEPAPDPASLPPAASDAGGRDAGTTRRREQVVRALALPGALLVARLAVADLPGAIRLFTMWVHESGHAVTAWLCGYTAWPGPWVTVVSPQRSSLFSALLAGAIGFGGYRALQLRRWLWLTASIATMAALFVCTVALSPVQAQQLITFGGDGGSLALGTLLMLTLYAREDHPMRENHLRWALLVIGALAFADAYAVWSGPIDHLPFGEDENGISDASVLTEEYGWNVLMLVRRYRGLAFVCLAVLAVVYLTELYRGARQQAASVEAPAARGAI